MEQPGLKLAHRSGDNFVEWALATKSGARGASLLFA